MRLSRFLSLVVALVVGALLVSSLPAQAEPSKSRPGRTVELRVLTIGDSITQGIAGDYTWRFRLQRSLEAVQSRSFDVAGRARTYDFVGNRTATFDQPTRTETDDYADPRFDRDHAGVLGMRASAVRYDVAELVRTTNPHVIVLSLGLNDLLKGSTPAAVVPHIERIIETAREAAPGVAIVLGHLTSPWIRGVNDLNNRLTQLATRLDRRGARVDIAAVPPGYQQGQDTWDRYHPNGVGEVKMAHEIHLSLHRLGLAARPLPLNPAGFPAAGPPRALAAVRTVPAPRGFVVSWTLPTGVYGAQVSYRNVTTGGPWVVHRGAPVMGLDTRVQALKTGHTYEVRVVPARLGAVSATRYTVVQRVRAG